MFSTSSIDAGLFGDAARPSADFETAVCSARSRLTPAGRMPAMAFRRACPEGGGRLDRVADRLQELGFAAGHAEQSAFAGIPVARRRVEQHQLQAMLASAASRRARGPASCTNRISTRAKPAAAAAPKRSYTSSSGQSIDRFAAKRGTLTSASSTVTPAGSSHSLTSAAMSSSPRPRARASEKRCSARAPSSSGTPPVSGLVVNQPQILQDQSDGRGAAEVARHEARQVARHHGRATKRRADQVEHDLRVGAEARSEDGRLGDGRRVHADQQLIDELHHLTSADRAAQTDVLARRPGAPATPASKTDCSPPTMTVSVPAWAPAGPPETGASRKLGASGVQLLGAPAIQARADRRVIDERLASSRASGELGDTRSRPTRAWAAPS